METSNFVIINCYKRITSQILIIIIIKNTNQFYNGYGALKTIRKKTILSISTKDMQCDLQYASHKSYTTPNLDDSSSEGLYKLYKRCTSLRKKMSIEE